MMVIRQRVYPMDDRGAWVSVGKSEAVWGRVRSVCMDEWVRRGENGRNDEYKAIHHTCA